MGGDGGVGHRADRAGAAAPQASAGNAYGRDQKAARRRLPVRDREPPSGPSQMPPVSGFGPGGDLSGIWSGGWSGLSIAWTAMALAGQLCYLTPAARYSPLVAGRTATTGVDSSSPICRFSSAVEQRFCKPKVGSSILSTGTSNVGRDICKAAAPPDPGFLVSGWALTSSPPPAGSCSALERGVIRLDRLIAGRRIGDDGADRQFASADQLHLGIADAEDVIGIDQDAPGLEEIGRASCR